MFVFVLSAANPSEKQKLTSNGRTQRHSGRAVLIEKFGFSKGWRPPSAIPTAAATR